MSEAPFTSISLEFDERTRRITPLAWGCDFCRAVAIGPARKPSHDDCPLGGEFQALVPLETMRDLMLSLRDADSGTRS